MRPENSTIDGVPRPRLRTKTISYGAVVVMNHARTIAPSLPPSSPANQSCKSVRSRNKNGAQWIGLLGLLSTSPSVRCHAVSHFNINISLLSRPLTLVFWFTTRSGDENERKLNFGAPLHTRTVHVGHSIRHFQTRNLVF
jgi:hypothetical protein